MLGIYASKSILSILGLYMFHFDGCRIIKLVISSALTTFYYLNVHY
jgi:hypothetical protein